MSRQRYGLPSPIRSTLRPWWFRSDELAAPVSDRTRSLVGSTPHRGREMAINSLEDLDMPPDIIADIRRLDRLDSLGKFRARNGPERRPWTCV